MRTVAGEELGDRSGGGKVCRVRFELSWLYFENRTTWDLAETRKKRVSQQRTSRVPVRPTRDKLTNPRRSCFEGDSSASCLAFLEMGKDCSCSPPRDCALFFFELLFVVVFSLLGTVVVGAASELLGLVGLNVPSDDIILSEIRDCRSW